MTQSRWNKFKVNKLLNPKIKPKQNLNLNPNTKHENQRQGHEICEAKVQKEFYSYNIWKYEHKMKWTRWWRKSYFKLMLNKLK